MPQLVGRGVVAGHRVAAVEHRIAVARDSQAHLGHHQQDRQQDQHAHPAAAPGRGALGGEERAHVAELALGRVRGEPEALPVAIAKVQGIRAVQAAERADGAEPDHIGGGQEQPAQARPQRVAQPGKEAVDAAPRAAGAHGHQADHQRQGPHHVGHDVPADGIEDATGHEADHQLHRRAGRAAGGGGRLRGEPRAGLQWILGVAQLRPLPVNRQAAGQAAADGISIDTPRPASVSAGVQGQGRPPTRWKRKSRGVAGVPPAMRPPSQRGWKATARKAVSPATALKGGPPKPGISTRRSSQSAS
jgi:hypothetical protein